MANQWFKFYGPEYLSDQKLLGMDGNTRSCWVTLLSYACKDGPEIRYLSEEQLMLHAGVPIGGEEWQNTSGVLKKFEERGMIELSENLVRVLNWEKRQESNLTGYERVKRHRQKNRDVIDDNEMITLEENRIEKNRIEKKTASITYLTETPTDDLKELSEKYDASVAQIKRKAETMKNYCLSKGKSYKNYRAFLENGLDKDFGRRVLAGPAEKLEKRPLTDEEQAARDRISIQIKAIGKAKTVV